MDLPIQPTVAAPEQWLDLSAAQRSIWLDMQLQDDPAGYQLGGWARVDAALDPDLATQAVRLVVARNDALRLRVDKLQPRMRLTAASTMAVTLSDLSDRPDPHAAFRDFAAQAFAHGLPLGDVPLLRVDLVRAGPRCWYLLWRCHHLVSDQVSVAIGLRRWTEAYDALAGDLGTELSSGSSFVGAVDALRAYENSPQAEADLAYWRRRLAERPEPMFLQGKPEASATPIGWEMSAEAYRQFRAGCRRCGVKTERGVLGLVALTLAQLFDRRSVVLGVALHGRDFATRETVGMFSGLLPVPCNVDPEAALDEALAAIGSLLDRDMRHRRASIDAIGRALGSGHEVPLVEFVVSHVVEEAPPPPLALSGTPLVSEFYRAAETTPAALYVVEQLHRQRIRFEIAVNPAFVDPSLHRRLATALQRASESLIDAPETLVAELDLLAAEDRAFILDAGTGPAATFETGTLPSLFAAQASRTPDAEAVAEGARFLSYAALDRASDAVAAALQQRGVGLETVVGVALARSLETVVYALAVLKAGGVYLPLDPAYPPDRLAFMLDDAHAALVLTDAATAPHLPISVPQYQPDLTATGTPHPPALEPDHLAYIVYTSGSTGTPKGVAVSHAAAVNLAFARRHGHDPIGPGDRVLAAISVGFDVSIGQLLLPLLSGACVVVAPDLRTLSADAFWALIEEGRVSHVNSVPSFFDSVLDAAPPAAGLQRLMLGGEALTGALCRRLQAALPNTMLVNMYGPTEACIDATAYLVPTQPGDGVMPIGRPLANYRAYVLDARLRLVPPGVAGELFLGGAGLARGYVGQPDLTATRFLPDPFNSPGRLYRTGDRAAWRPDGTLAFLGRDDDQVKIRGFRVELGEIEAALASHPAVQQAAVAAHADPTAGVSLTAHIVGDADPEELRAHLARRLPAHMLPADIVTLSAMPLTQNGKLDRKALPRPTQHASRHYIAPATPLEQQLATIFAELLGVDRVGATDDFFTLGGHSLTAIRLIGAINAAFHVDLPISALLEAPTVAAIAAALRGAATHATKTIITLQTGAADRARLVCVHPQGGTAFCYAGLVRHLPADLAILGLQAAGFAPGESLPESIETIAAAYVAALPPGPVVLVGYSLGGTIAFEMAVQMRQAGREVVGLALLDTWHPDACPAPHQTRAELLAMLGDDIGLPAATPPWQTTEQLFAAAQAAGVLPQNFTIDRAERIVSVWANNARLVTKYRPQNASKAVDLDVPLLQIRASDRTLPFSDWTGATRGPVRTVDLDCDHREIIAEPHAAGVADAIERHLLNLNP